MSRYAAWVNICQSALAFALPCPAFVSALCYFESLRAGRLPANLIQAQRDFFGAHTFERVDRPGAFHHSWNNPNSSR
jgi:6-phosphogluconate dehydrogenase